MKQVNFTVESAEQAVWLIYGKRSERSNPEADGPEGKFAQSIAGRNAPRGEKSIFLKGEYDENWC